MNDEATNPHPKSVVGGETADNEGKHPASAEGVPVRARVAGADWFALTPELQGGPLPIAQQRFNANLTGLLGAQNVVVLCGLGTSLGITKFSSSDDPPPTAGAPSMWDLYEGVKSLEGFELAEQLIDPEARTRGDVEDLLSKCQFKLALSTGELNPADVRLAAFVLAAEHKILELCSFVSADTDLGTHEVFLRKIARRQSRLSRAQVFTTNYDLAFERAAERIRFTVIDGFGFGAGYPFDGSGFDMDIVRRNHEENTLEANVFHLLKLHGSVDWSEDGREVRRVARGAKPSKPVLIYPAEDKFQLSYRPPYLESMSRLQMALREDDVSLIVAGFGFNDAHITAPIEAAVRSNIGLQILVVDPAAEAMTSTTLQVLNRLLDAGDRRVSLLGSTFDRFVELLPDVHAPDERELQRLRTDQAWEGQ